MALMTIGEFAGRTRLSAKALRLYGRLGLVVPVGASHKTSTLVMKAERNRSQAAARVRSCQLAQRRVTRGEAGNDVKSRLVGQRREHSHDCLPGHPSSSTSG